MPKREEERVRSPPLKPAIKRRVVIPASIFVGEEQRLATFRLGLIARYLTIFRVEEVLVFGEGDELVMDVLRYAETPQYLRRKLIPLKSALKFCGVIPPLQSPHHPSSAKGRGFLCDYREGIVLKAFSGSVLVDIGLKEPVLAEGSAKPRERVTVMLSGRPKLIDRKMVPVYWGYEVFSAPDLRSAVELSKDYLKVATSRLGDPVGSIAERLAEDAKRCRKVAVFFGERERGLLDIALEEGFDPSSAFDYIVNLVPQQGVFTIRTEEAIPIALAILDFLLL